MDTNLKNTPIIQNKWKPLQNNSVKMESSDINYDDNWPVIGESIKEKTIETVYIPQHLQNKVSIPSHTEFLPTEYKITHKVKKKADLKKKVIFEKKSDTVKEVSIKTEIKLEDIFKDSQLLVPLMNEKNIIKILEKMEHSPSGAGLMLTILEHFEHPWNYLEKYKHLFSYLLHKKNKEYLIAVLEIIQKYYNNNEKKIKINDTLQHPIELLFNKLLSLELLEPEIFVDWSYEDSTIEGKQFALFKTTKFITLMKELVECNNDSENEDND
jgi:hypothetical protein